MPTGWLQKIKRYEEDIFDLDVSPFETIAILHLRSELERVFPAMNSDEQLELLSVDVKGLKNARNIADHLKDIYDSSTSKKPETEWWWHLDKVAEGKIIIKSNPLFVAKDVAL
jgi:hypothetical protein